MTEVVLFSPFGWFYFSRFVPCMCACGPIIYRRKGDEREAIKTMINVFASLLYIFAVEYINRNECDALYIYINIALYCGLTTLTNVHSERIISWMQMRPTGGVCVSLNVLRIFKTLTICVTSAKWLCFAEFLVVQNWNPALRLHHTCSMFPFCNEM